MHRVAKHRLKRRLERERRFPIKRHVSDAELRRQFEFARNIGEAAVGAIKLQPASTAQIVRRSSFVAECFVLAHRMRKQRPHCLRGFDQTCRLRRGAEC